MSDGVHCLRPWGAGVSLEAAEGASYQARVRYFCRMQGTRMDFVLGLAEKGVSEEAFRETYNEEAAKRKWGAMPESEAESVYAVAKLILREKLSSGEMSDAVSAQQDFDSDMRGKGKRISWKRALRIVKVVVLRAIEGRNYEEIAYRLGEKVSTVAKDFNDFVNGNIAGVYGGNKGVIPFDEWLDKHDKEGLKCFRRKRSATDCE